MKERDLTYTGWAFFAICLLVFIFFGGWHIGLLFSEKEKKIEDIVKRYEEEERNILPQRGKIFSDDGKLLASSVLGYQISFDAKTGYASLKDVTDLEKIQKKNQAFEKYITELVPQLAPLVNRPEEVLLKKIRKAREVEKGKGGGTILISEEIFSMEVKEKIESIPMLLKTEGKDKGKYKGQNSTGIVFTQIGKREHPFKDYSQRVVGKYDPIYAENSSGIEAAFDSILRGKVGKEKTKRVKRGVYARVDEGLIEEVEHGKDVYATIDVNMQYATYEALLNQLKKYEANHGCAVVMEVKTGKIKAISNLSFDPKSGTYYEMENHAVASRYSPGSTFKPISAIALMDDKKIDTLRMVNSPSRAVYHKMSLENSNSVNHGNISFAKSIVVSSNTAITKLISDNYNNKSFYEKLLQLKINEPLNLPFKEAKPSLKYLPKEGFKAEYVWNSYGYGLALSPLKMLTYYNAIANDGVMLKPRLVSKITQDDKVVEEFQKEVIAENLWSVQTNSKIKKILENVVKQKHGTAHNLYMKDLPIAGKTGTSQIENTKEYIATFVGYFPADNPKYSCIALVYKPNKKIGYYGGKVAGEIVKQIARDIYKAPLKENKVVLQQGDKVQTQSNKSFTWNDKTLMPNVVGLHPMKAIPMLEKAGLIVKIEGEGSKIVKQSVAKGKPIRSVKEVTLTLN